MLGNLGCHSPSSHKLLPTSNFSKDVYILVTECFQQGGYQSKLGQRSHDSGTGQHSYGSNRTGNYRNFSATTGYRRGRIGTGNNHHLMAITDYNLPITVTYLNYLKQRKVRKPCVRKQFA